MSNLKRFLALTLAMLMVVGAMVTVSAKSFEDVAATDSYAEAVDVLSELGVILGATETEFNPDALVERQQMAMFIARLATAQPALFAVEAGAIFADQTAPVYNAAIQYAYTNSIIAGRTATTFDGAATVTLQEAAAMLSRALGYGNKTNNASYPFSYMVIANEIGLLAGLEDVVPTAALTRGEVATLLYNALFAPKADRELLYTPDGQDWVVSIPENFSDNNPATLFDSLATKAWKCTVTTGDYINATQKAAIGGAAVTAATKSIADPVTLNVAIPGITNRFSFAALSKYFAEDTTANDMLGVELSILSRAGKILKIDVVGSKTVTTDASYNKDTNVLTVNGSAYNLTQYLNDTYPSESDNCFYIYNGANKIVRNVPGDVDAAYAQIATGFFTIEVINAGLNSQMLVYKPYSFGKVVADTNADTILEIARFDTNANIGNINSNTISAVANDYVAYFNGGNLNVDLIAKATKSDASKALLINNTASTATLANGTVIPTGSTVVTGAGFAAIAINGEYHAFTVDGKIIATIAKDAAPAGYAPLNYYKVLAADLITEFGTRTFKLKVVNNAGVESAIIVTSLNGNLLANVDIDPTAAVDLLNTAVEFETYLGVNATTGIGPVITIDSTDATKIYTVATPASFFTTFAGVIDTAYSEAAVTSFSKPAGSNVFTIDGAAANDTSFILADYSKIVVKATDGYVVVNGKSFNGFAAQTLTNAYAVIHVNVAGVNELAYVYVQSNVAKASVLAGGPVSPVKPYVFLGIAEQTVNTVKYNAFNLITGVVDQLTFTGADEAAKNAIIAGITLSTDASVGAYDVQSSAAAPAATGAITPFKFAPGYVVDGGTPYTLNNTKYYQWDAANDKLVAKTIADFTVGTSYEGALVTSNGNADYVIVRATSAVVAAVVPSPLPTAGAIGTGAVVITLTAEAGATIFYTLDGSNPTLGSAFIASGATVTIPAGGAVGNTVTLKAFSTLADKNASAVVTYTYTK